ncbi:restriction endonuclease subunit S [Tenacibaculum maritimum]|uniref:restriction endonuclease subunit S n=1 Tax=Tenacibaculum maritimum TaxID=107401 RepID=UPI0038764D7E
MELATKQGFKQTEIGLIPEDWSVKKFKDIFRVNQGLQIPIQQRLKCPTPNSKKYITIQYLNDGKGVEYINDYSVSVCCSENDILMTRTGNTGMVITNVNGVFHNNFFKINYDRNRLDKNYIVFYLKQNTTQIRILEKAGTSTIPDLNHNDFYSLQIPLPPTLKEQKAIATALSDVDDLIASLEGLIAKKQAIKQGAMQQLLTPPHKGGKRLPGFSGGWVEKSIGGLFKISAGGDLDKNHYSEIKNYEHQYCIFANALSNKGVYGYTSNPKYKGNSITVTARGTLGHAEYRKDDFDAIVRLLVLEPILKLSCLFFSEYINNCIQFAYESTGVPQLTGPQISRYFICFPLDFNEQKAIAKILSDMDAELEQLETKKAKYQQLKQGMLQELLTGNTRLV